MGKKSRSLRLDTALPGFHKPLKNKGCGHPVGKVGIIDRGEAVGTKIEHDEALGRQVPLEGFFEREAGVIGREGNGFLAHFGPFCLPVAAPRRANIPYIRFGSNATPASSRPIYTGTLLTCYWKARALKNVRLDYDWI